MTPNQLPPLPEPHIGLPWRHNAKDGSIHSSAFTWAQMHAYALAALAQQAQPVHQFRRRLCADWYDGHPDHEDGGGPYETRILYTTPPAPQVPAPVDEREAFENCALMVGSLFKRRADDPDKYWDGNVQDDWELWQARAALQSPAPQTKGGEA